MLAEDGDVKEMDSLDHCGVRNSKVKKQKKIAARKTLLPGSGLVKKEGTCSRVEQFKRLPPSSLSSTLRKDDTWIPVHFLRS